MAERVGFEPTVRSRAQRFSRPPRSATLAPLQTGRIYRTTIIRQATTPVPTPPRRRLEQPRFADPQTRGAELTSRPTRPTISIHQPKETIMAWKSPKIVEIALDAEINSYACAEAKK